MQTLQTVAQDYDWSDFYDIGPAGRVGPLAAVFIILLLPLFAIDLMSVLFHPDVLGQYLRFIFLFAFALGFIPSAFTSIIVLSVSFVRRLKKRLKRDRLAS